MATRSFIATNLDGRIRGVYCHFDGYVKGGVGETLRKSWTQDQDIEKLINGGAMSTLGDTYEKCEFYTQRGEELSIIETSEISELQDIAKDHGAEFFHFWSQYEQKWTHIHL